ncbi:hypothetical protein [Sphingomonas sp. PB4P5]|uniref:hypothetical protein n=1 Tax=Parasphingomonas puruogangriensis TaxID=3096155 RepID=UPI002FC61BED
MALRANNDVAVREMEELGYRVQARPLAGLNQRNREVIQAYVGVINDDSAAGRAARHVRDTLLARQVSK